MEKYLENFRIPRYLTTASLVALVFGLGLGALTHGWEHPFAKSFSGFVQPIGSLWINALRLMVLPLLVSLLVSLITTREDVRETGKIAGYTFLTFSVLLISAALITWVITVPLVDWIPFSKSGVEAFNNLSSSSTTEAPTVQTSALSEWFKGLIPSNLLKAAVEEELLPIYLAVILFALALRQIRSDLRDIIIQINQAILETSLVIIHWLLISMPAGVFALSFGFTRESGIGLIGVLGYYVFLSTALLILAIVGLYVLIGLLGPISIKKFGQSLIPAQITAISTRSSIACLPALVEGAADRLKLPQVLISGVIPLCVATFKLSRPVTSTFKLLFLAQVHGLDLAVPAILFFIGMQFFFSMNSPGIPQEGFSLAMPLYLSMGIPLESYILMKTIDVIPDVAKTLLNVTANMWVLLFVSRLMGDSKAEVQESI